MIPDSLPSDSTDDGPCGANTQSADLHSLHLGILAALPGELGVFLRGGSPLASPFGVELIEVEIPGQRQRITAAVSGVGKVAATRAALALIAHGAQGLFVVGTCGGLTRGVPVGELVHLKRAIQWDLAVREGRTSQAFAPWAERWREIA
ncbi:MAG: hypothetical protein AAGG01_17280, partial [Planctomycetota bacterium]